jgi:hypothetical protein
MVNNDTHSNLMLRSTIFWIIWTILIFFSSFLCHFVIPFFSLDAQCCYFCLPNPFHIYLFHSIHWLEPDSTRNMFRTLLLATPSLKQNTASYTPNLSVSSLTKTVLHILPVSLPLSIYLRPYTNGCFYHTACSW